MSEGLCLHDGQEWVCLLGCGLCASTLQRRGVLALEKAQERPWRLCQPHPCDRAEREASQALPSA